MKGFSEEFKSMFPGWKLGDPCPGCGVVLDAEGDTVEEGHEEFCPYVTFGQG